MDGGQSSLKRQNSKAMPEDIIGYIEEHEINSIVKSSLNRVLREKPADPLANLAAMLIASAKKSYPVFKRFEARRVFLCDSVQYQSISIDVHLSFQGRTEVKHSHIFTYDESNHGPNYFYWDKPEECSGLSKTCALINDDLNSQLRDIVLNNSIQADNILDSFLHSEVDKEHPIVKVNVVRACSEALMFAVAKCFSPQDVFEGFKESFYPRDEEVEGTKNTKLMVTVLNGGKHVNSQVKFSKFYLIIDAASQTNAEAVVDPLEITNFYQKFLVAFKKGIIATKAGEAGFKLGTDGAYFNANLTIGESFKMMEDAIALSGANDDGRKLFQIGFNCDGDTIFNKDPKEPNKYEQEGQKLLFDTAQMREYYCKIL